MKMRWQTIASNVSIRTISPTATPLPKAYDCVAVYIAGRRTSLVVYGWWPQPPTKKEGWRGTNNLHINGVDVILNLIFLFQNITSVLKNFQVAQDVTILHHFPYQKGSLFNLS